MASNNTTAFTLAIFTAGAAPGDATATSLAPPASAARLTRIQQPDLTGTVTVCRFCACCAKQLAIKRTLIYKKVPGGGKCTRCTRNGSKCKKVSDTPCCVAVWLRSGVM